MKVTSLLFPLALALTASGVLADGHAGEVNLYSSRHYDTDEKLYADFTEATGIKINRVEGSADELLQRIKAEGEASPADIYLTVDTTRLERAKDAGILAALDSEVLETAIPSNLQDADNMWFGFSQRSRIIFYDKTQVSEPPLTYLDLADPKYKGMICHRSSSNVYTQTLLSAIIQNHGEKAATDWAKGMVANFARDPQGGDTDQLRGLVSGECLISISNTYYFARAIRRDVKGLSAEDRKNIGWIFPSQEAEGAHMNLSGAGLTANAPNRENAIKFLEYLASPSAQKYFSEGNDEYPVVAGVEMAPSVQALGTFKADKVDLSAVAKNVAAAQKILNQVGWR